MILVFRGLHQPVELNGVIFASRFPSVAATILAVEEPGRGFEATLKAFVDEHRCATEERDLMRLIDLENDIVIRALKPFLH